MKIAFSWDDGAPEDLKLMDLHRKYDIPGMFFIPTENCEGREVLTKEQIRENDSPLISFGGHTQHHKYLTLIPPENVFSEVSDNQKYLEDILGRKIPHFCLPGGQYNDEILKTVYQLFDTCRTADTMSFSQKGRLLIPSFHFYPRGIRSIVGNSFRHGNGNLGIKVLLHSRMSYYQLLRYLTDMVSEKNDSLVIVWGHSWEIEKLGLWNELEQYMSFVKEKYGDQIVSYDQLIQLK